MSERKRSPNYARVSLKTIKERLVKYASNTDKEKYTEEEIAKKLHYSGITGASLPIISALKKFGLLESVGDNRFVFTDDVAKLISFNYKDNEYSTFIENIAFRPVLYQEIKNHFGKGIPDRNKFKEFLEIKGFISNSISTAIEAYTETIELIAETHQDYRQDQNDKTALDKKVSPDLTEDSILKAHSKDSVESVQEIKIKLADVISLIVQIEGVPSTTSMDKLAKFWRVNKDLFEDIKK